MKVIYMGGGINVLKFNSGEEVVLTDQDLDDLKSELCTCNDKEQNYNSLLPEDNQ